ncbi:hypothetical protein OIU77_025156 [Salix suchowensis]|uniref:Uncharacterized protein n=1 Tax=Salix suchowensis TaxID=1278906 RepID=A0ABQ9BWX8_9ROSI|nr:hypothetical protein OIU77_025156 [Salix suchowensis]
MAVQRKWKMNRELSLLCMFLKGFTIFTALTESKGQDFTFQSGESSDKGNESCLDKTCCGDCRVSCNLLERGEVYACGVFLLELITWKDAALHRMEMKAYFQPQ